MSQSETVCSVMNGCVTSTNAARSFSPYIEFGHSIIKTSPIDGIVMSDSEMDKVMLRWMQIEKLWETHEYIMNADVRSLFDVSVATVNYILATIVAEGKLKKCRQKRLLGLLIE